MEINTHHSSTHAAFNAVSLPGEHSFLDALAPQAPPAGNELLQSSAEESNTESSDELKAAFHDFVGQTFFGEMIKSFRSTQQPSKYFHGGRAEEIFQGQFDQVLTEKLSDASAAKIADPMFDLFMLKRSS